jgi:hypothetical protein
MTLATHRKGLTQHGTKVAAGLRRLHARLSLIFCEGESMAEEDRVG